MMNFRNIEDGMQVEDDAFEDYFSHLQKISFLGRVYKKFFSSPILFLCARYFGRRIVEIGSGTGSGILGTFPKRVYGLEINPLAVKYTKAAGFNVDLIESDGIFPTADGVFDVCVLDNVLEHLSEPRLTLDECHRVTKETGGLVIVVPGKRGFDSDKDHKVFYELDALSQLDPRWKMIAIFSIPFIFTSKKLSKSVRQYCLVAIYKKI